jgi:hypothetical protein
MWTQQKNNRLNKGSIDNYQMNSKHFVKINQIFEAKLTSESHDTRV